MSSNGREVVLCADDEPGVRMALKLELKDRFEVLTAEDGQDALELIASAPVDILVSDIDMPRLDGLLLSQKVRAEHPHVVRVILTGRTDLQTALTAINQGEVFRFLNKPWNEQQLAEVMKAAVEHSRLLRKQFPKEDPRHELLDKLSAEFPGLTRVDLLQPYTPSIEAARELHPRLPPDWWRLIRGGT